MEEVQKHKTFLDRQDFTIPEGLHCLFTKEEIPLLRKYGFWMEALARGEIHPISDEQKSFLLVASGERPPTTKFEKAWLKLSLSKDPEFLCEFARSLQERGTGYSRILQVYQLAASAGSARALNWLKEQRLPPIKPNSFFTRPEGGMGGELKSGPARDTFGFDRSRKRWRKPDS